MEKVLLEMRLALKAAQEDVHKTAREAGWWDEGKQKTFGEAIALVHSELSEALEEFRNNNAPHHIYSVNGKPEGVAVELADVIVRLLDMAEFFQIPLEEAYDLKTEYNRTRPYRHGNKAL